MTVAPLSSTHPLKVVTQAELVNFLRNHATGSFDPLTDTVVPNGIYIPIDNQTTKNLSGGIYVEGDVQIQLSTAEGSASFGANY